MSNSILTAEVVRILTGWTGVKGNSADTVEPFKQLEESIPQANLVAGMVYYIIKKGVELDAELPALLAEGYVTSGHKRSLNKKGSEEQVILPELRAESAVDYLALCQRQFFNRRDLAGLASLYKDINELTADSKATKTDLGAMLMRVLDFFMPAEEKRIYNEKISIEVEQERKLSAYAAMGLRNLKQREFYITGECDMMLVQSIMGLLSAEHDILNGGLPRPKMVDGNMVMEICFKVKD